MWCFFKLALLVVPVFCSSSEDEDILARRSSDSHPHQEFPDPFHSDSEWDDFPTFQPVTFYPPTDKDSSSESESSDESDSEDEQIRDGEVCEIPKIENGYFVDTTRPIKVGAARQIRCNAGYCLTDPADSDLPAKVTTFNCTEKMAQDDTYCGLPVCVEDVCHNEGALCEDGKELCNQNKVTIVKGFLKEGHAALKINWFSKDEERAEKYLTTTKGYEGVELLKFTGLGMCNRHLATGYFNSWRNYLRQKYYGGWVGCAVSADYRNIVACIVRPK